MSASEALPVSRRQFLSGCAGCVAAATPAVAEPSPNQHASLGDYGGDISSEGRASIAEVDQRFAQQRAPMQQTVDAVKDIGLDPTGQQPIGGQLESAVSGLSNARIVFPSGGTFLVTEQVSVSPNGPIEIVGNGCSFALPPNTETRSFMFDLPGGSLIQDIVIDQSANGAVQELTVQSDGVVRADNVTVQGYASASPNIGATGNGSSNVDSIFSPIARTEDAVIRATNFTAVGGSAAGTHDDPGLPASAPENRLGAPIGIWVGESNLGTVQLVNLKLGGWSNGIYGGRTTGKVEVRGGQFINNFNAQARIGGGSIVDGASMLLDDRQWSDKGPYSIGHQGVYAARIDAKHGNTTDPAQFINLDVRALSMREGASLIDFESSSGSGIIRNCRFENHLDRPVVLGESPSGASATNIMVDQCLVTGSSPAEVIDVRGRPQSVIQNTCIATPGAGPGDIQGARIGDGVSFGQTCSAGGLSNPDAVGSAGNLSSLPPVNASAGNYSAVNYSQGNTQAQTDGIIKAVVSAVFMVIAGIALLAFGIAGLALIFGGIGTVLVYLLSDE